VLIFNAYLYRLICGKYRVYTYDENGMPCLYYRDMYSGKILRNIDWTDLKSDDFQYIKTLDLETLSALDLWYDDGIVIKDYK
jgi:hypothetical protein